MLKKLGVLSGAVTVALALALGVREAAAAQAYAKTAQCGSYNWCAPSIGGQGNCDECCIAADPNSSGGICYDPREEDGFIGCLCT